LDWINLGVATVAAAALPSRINAEHAKPTIVLAREGKEPWMGRRTNLKRGGRKKVDIESIEIIMTIYTIISIMQVIWPRKQKFLGFQGNGSEAPPGRVSECAARALALEQGTGK
jgi:hypothetical protein